LHGEGWERGTKCGKLRRIRCKFATGGGKKSIKNGAAQSGFGKLRGQRLEFWGDHQDTLGLQGPANSGQGLGEVVFSKGPGFVCIGARFDGAFEEGRQNQASFLEIGEDFFGGLPCRGDAESREESSGLSREAGFGGIEKVGVSFGSGSGKQEGLDVDGAETRGPLEALQAASYVFGGGKLSATIARQKCGNGHIQKW